MAEWWTELAAFHDHIWSALEAGAARRDRSRRFLALATAGQTGGAEARMVVLRGAERELGRLIVHTDTLSAKVAELRADPRATLLSWDPEEQLQIRVKVEVGIDTGSVVRRDWERIPETARRVYGNQPEPGGPMACPQALTVTPDQDRFAVMTCTMSEIDALHLGREVHHRAIWRRRGGWAGRWIAP